MANLGEEIGEPFEVPITTQPATHTEPGIPTPSFEPAPAQPATTPERELTPA